MRNPEKNHEPKKKENQNVCVVFRENDAYNPKAIDAVKEAIREAVDGEIEIYSIPRECTDEALTNEIKAMGIDPNKENQLMLVDQTVSDEYKKIDNPISHEKEISLNRILNSLAESFFSGAKESTRDRNLMTLSPEERKKSATKSWEKTKDLVIGYFSRAMENYESLNGSQPDSITIVCKKLSDPGHLTHPDYIFHTGERRFREEPELLERFRMEADNAIGNDIKDWLEASGVSPEKIIVIENTEKTDSSYNDKISKISGERGAHDWIILDRHLQRDVKIFPGNTFQMPIESLLEDFHKRNLIKISPDEKAELIRKHTVKSIENQLWRQKNLY